MLWNTWSGFLEVLDIQSTPKPLWGPQLQDEVPLPKGHKMRQWVDLQLKQLIATWVRNIRAKPSPLLHPSLCEVWAVPLLAWPLSSTSLLNPTALREKSNRFHASGQVCISLPSQPSNDYENLIYLAAQEPGAPRWWWGGSSISRGEGWRIGNNYTVPWWKNLVGLNPKLEEGSLNPPLL